MSSLSCFDVLLLDYAHVRSSEPPRRRPARAVNDSRERLALQPLFLPVSPSVDVIGLVQRLCRAISRGINAWTRVYARTIGDLLDQRPRG